MNDTELDFAIDVVEPEAAPRSRTGLRLTLVACALSSSATFLLGWQLEASSERPAPAVAGVRVARTPTAPAAPAVAVAPPPAPDVAETLALELPPEPARTAAPPPPKRHKPAQATENVRASIQGGAFVLERTGAAPVVAAKRAVVVRAVDDPDDVESVLRDRASAFRACYEHGLRDDASFAGSFTLRFTIDTEGAVQQAQVHPHAPVAPAVAAPFRRCLQQTLKRARFAPTSQPTTVTRTLTFRRQTSI